MIRHISLSEHEEMPKSRRIMIRLISLSGWDTKGVQFSYSVNLKFHFYKRGISDLDCSKIQHPYAQYQ